MKSDFSHELSLANKACNLAIRLGKIRGYEYGFTTGYCAIAATWLAREINKQTPGKARVVCGRYKLLQHTWVVLDNVWVLDPTHEQFKAKEPVYWGSVDQSVNYTDTLSTFDKWYSWQIPTKGVVNNFGLMVEGAIRPEDLFFESRAM